MRDSPGNKEVQPQARSEKDRAMFPRYGPSVRDPAIVLYATRWPDVVEATTYLLDLK